MERLRQWRAQQGITQEAAAARFRVRRETIIRWESGEFVPDMAKIVEIEDVTEGFVRASDWANAQRARGAA